MGNHVPGTPLETLGSIYIRSALEFRNLENTTVRDQLSLINNSKSNSYKPWGKGWGGGSISFVAIPAKWRYLQYCNELNILNCIKKGMLLTNLLINIINHIIPLLKKTDLFGIPLKWANTKKWGWDLWGQIHTKRSIWAPQEVTFFGSFVHRKVGGSVIQLRMQEIQFCGGRTEGKKENIPTLSDPFTDKSHLCAIDIQARY